MGQRKRTSNFLEGILGLGLALVALLSLSTGGRAFISLLPVILLGAVALMIVVLLGVSLLRRANKARVGHDQGAPFMAPPPAAPQVQICLHKIDWFQFEKLIAALYQSQGCAVTRNGGAKPDGGVDLVVELAGEKWLIQCKHWKSWRVSVKNVRELLGSMQDADIRRARLITLQGYSPDAQELAARHGIELLEETDVVAMIEKMGGMSNALIRTLLDDKRKYCPKCEAPMELRTTRRGVNAGSQFWGCSAYPRCNFTFERER